MSIEVPLFRIDAFRSMTLKHEVSIQVLATWIRYNVGVSNESET